MSVALLSVIPPESADACLAERRDCREAMESLLAASEDGESRFFPPASLTRQWLDTERSRFAWQSKVRLAAPDIAWISELEEATLAVGGADSDERGGAGGDEEAATVVYLGAAHPLARAGAASPATAPPTSVVALMPEGGELRASAATSEALWGTFDLWRPTSPLGGELAIGAPAESPGAGVPLAEFERQRMDRDTHTPDRRQRRERAQRRSRGHSHSGGKRARGDGDERRAGG